MMNKILRKEWLNFLIRYKDKNIIKVVSGVRRCGKSTLFELYQEHLLKHGIAKKNIIAFNFEDLENESIRTYKELYDTIKGRLSPNGKNYVFLDEVQLLQNFEKAVDSLFIKKNVDLYITGSNAYFMSGELATLLSGRYVELKMLPLSFKEYSIGCKMFRKNDRKKSIEDLYFDYLSESSFPYTLQLNGKKEDIREYLQGIYSSILLKDIVARLKISEVMQLESIVKFIFDSIGSQLSTTKIANTMKSPGRKIDTKTVEKYICGLKDSLILYYAGRFDIKGKQYLSTLGKYYVVDIGLRNMLLGNRGGEVGHILENVVYLELLRKNYKVSVGVIDDYEVDFVAENDMGITYFQVAASVRDTDVLNRELRSLQKIKDNYPKYLITLDNDPEVQHNGILQVNALKWLLE
ncbi:ATPase [Fibrobacterales bacterium]|nr:ATPase [Fibrobacterales bacterium]